MNYSKITFLTLALVLFTTLFATGQEAPSIPPSFYAKSELQKILNNEGCVAIRVYPVSDIKQKILTTMIIGIDIDGKELYSGFLPKVKYLMFKGVVDGKANYDPLNEINARLACDGYNILNHPKFVAVIKKSDVVSMLNNGNDGLRLSNIYADEKNNFEASGAKLNGNDFPPATAPIAGEPCPAMCGNPSNYVCPVN